MATRLTNMEFDEVSLVPTPANQMANVVLWKADASKEEDVPETDVQDQDQEIEKEGLPEEAVAYIEVLEETNGELRKQLDDLKVQVEQLNAAMEDDDDEEGDEDLLKSADPALVAMVKGLQDRAEAAEIIAKAERDHRLNQEFIAKAAEYDKLPTSPAEFGPVLKAMADKLDDQTMDAVTTLLRAANALIGEGNFQEIGKSGSQPATSMDRITAAANKLREADPTLTQEAAITKAVELDPSLYNAYKQEV